MFSSWEVIKATQILSRKNKNLLYYLFAAALQILRALKKKNQPSLRPKLNSRTWLAQGSRHYTWDMELVYTVTHFFQLLEEVGRAAGKKFVKKVDCLRVRIPRKKKIRFQREHSGRFLESFDAQS